MTKTYSRDATDNLLEDKVDLTYVDEGLRPKADVISTYTKDDVDAFLRGKQKTLSVQSPFTLLAAGALSIRLGDYASASTTQG